jgi:hypothetical protein
MSGAKIIGGLEDAVIGNFAGVILEGQRWVRADTIGWQPIETAPKDKFILAIRMEWWEPVNGDHRWTYSRIRETNWMVGSERWDFGGEKQPTHWMPRPDYLAPPVHANQGA